MLYKRDLRKAYRQFPIDSQDYHLLGYTWNSQFYFDTVLSMGLCSAAMACQRSTSAVTWILNQRGLTIFNYLDDFIGASPPTLATSHFHELGELLSSWLGRICCQILSSFSSNDLFGCCIQYYGL